MRHTIFTTDVLRSSILALAALTNLAAQAAQGPAQAAPGLGPDPGWPRQYSNANATLVLYQPQVDSWESFRRIHARFAVAVTPTKYSQAFYGALHIEADTLVDTESRTVAITNLTIADARYPGARNEAEAKNLVALTTELVPAQATTVSLDRVLAYLDEAKVKVKARQTAVSLDPPAILVSTQPAVLVIIDGDPVLYDIEKTNLQKVVNTNWDLFFDKEGKRYYLRNNKTWLGAKTLDAAWKPEKKLPADFARLPATEPYLEITQTAASPQQPSKVELVIVAHKPTELIVLDGPPSLQPVPDTQLMWVANTECDLFFSQADRNYYFLTSGRWFRAPELTGAKWAAATTSLPGDFKLIPLNHPRAHVLASVPGTRQAEEAVIAASIPQTATIDRKQAKAEVQYIGDPKFEPIAGTKILYATNTPNDVVLLDSVYYLCLEGVWLSSASATGPWTPADKVPEEIYAIPPESPKHNVTYVTIYESTPETVTYGYTAGYTGMYIGYGVAMWGTGYYYPPYYGWGYYPYPVYWPPAYYTYGASAWYNPATGAYARGSAVYGPYGGYGRAAAYNPSTGRYSWGQAAWGPYGAAASGGRYNPNTGTWAGGYRATNGYQSWGQSVVGRGDQWARTASYSDARGAVGAIQTSGGGKGIVARGSQGQGFVARSGAGDLYAGGDGNVYRRNQSGQWYKNSGGSWESVNQPAHRTGAEGAAASREQARNDGQSRAGTAGSGANSQAIQGLDRDAAARNWGNYNSAQRSSSSRQSSSYGGSGGGFRARGGGRRR